MTAMNQDWRKDPDPLAQAVAQAVQAGWFLIPQVGHGVCDNALVRSTEGFTDVVTIPEFGHATVVRLQGGPEPEHPRWPGYQWWRHLVPVDVAVNWVLADSRDDRPLVEWDLAQSQQEADYSA